ncbi:MAG: NAD(P)-dependent oxidoreductase [Planctomycetes bacterium]|nr:NAD(P)-dependent oxidoreductase [Planctomycetota bacterium]
MENEKSYGACVIGLGAMGMGAALSCIRGGLKTYGVDVVEKSLETLSEAGAAGVGRDASAFARVLDAVLVLVVNAEQARSALFAGQPCLADSLRPGTVVIVSATISQDEAKAIGRELEKRGLLALDGPVSGGAAKAAKGEMTVMGAGSPAAFAKAKPLLDVIAEKVYNIGPELGNGSMVKIIHQLLAGIHVAAAAEAMALASRAGIPLDLMYDVVTHAAGNSWMFENRMRHVLDGDYTPLSRVNIFVKDLGLVAASAQSLKFPLHLAAAALGMFTTANNAGYGDEDDSAVIKIFPGIALPEKKRD